MAIEREKKVLSGALMEVDFFPIWEDGRRLPTRAPKSSPSTGAQIRYNELCAKKKLIRLVNENFSKVDYFGHLTYRVSEAPMDEKQARKDINNYLRRVKRKREKQLEKKKAALKDAKDALLALPGNILLRDTVIQLQKQVKLLKKPFKYIYAIERVSRTTGRYAGRDNWHFHLFISGGLTSAMMEELWDAGTARINNFRPDRFGPDAAALYIIKDPQGRKRFAYSKTIRQPKIPKPKDGKVTKRQVERMCNERLDDAAYWQRRYKGYRFLRAYPRENPYNKQWYLTVIMYRTDADPPEWKEDEWNTEAGVE